MRLEGSCSCGRVRYSCEADGPVPFLRCYCTYCRKTGSGGFMINLLARAEGLEVEGGESVRVYRASIQRENDTEPRPSGHARHFCGDCGSHLWARHDRWPDLIHPVASSVDTPLPPAPKHSHIFLRSKPAWVSVEAGPADELFEQYPLETLEDWHRRHGLFEG